MHHDSISASLLDARPPLAGARIAILALRSWIPIEVALTPNQITVRPDPAVLTEERAAELLAANSLPARFAPPQVHDGVLVLKYETISEPLDRDRQELKYALTRRGLFGRRRDMSAQTLAEIRVLLDGRGERLLVTAEAFDCWHAMYDGPHACAGGPARDRWTDVIGLSKAGRASRADYVFRFGPPISTKSTLSRLEDLQADEVLNASAANCARCGKPASKILRKFSDDGNTSQQLCARCAGRAIPPRSLPRWPKNPAKLTPEILLQSLPYLKSDQRTPIRESLTRWMTWADRQFPAETTAPPDVAAIRAMIKVYRQALDLN
jgi:hypothetical protein